MGEREQNQRGPTCGHGHIDRPDRGSAVMSQVLTHPQSPRTRLITLIRGRCMFRLSDLNSLEESFKLNAVRVQETVMDQSTSMFLLNFNPIIINISLLNAISHILLFTCCKVETIKKR